MILALSATFSGSETVNFLDANGNSHGQGGVIQDVVILGADASTDVSIADGRGGGTGVATVFSVTSVDSTTVLRYKVDDSAIKRNSVTGKLTGTTANNTGALICYLWVRVPD